MAFVAAPSAFFASACVRPDSGRARFEAGFVDGFAARAGLRVAMGQAATGERAAEDGSDGARDAGTGVTESERSDSVEPAETRLRSRSGEGTVGPCHARALQRSPTTR